MADKSTENTNTHTHTLTHTCSHGNRSGWRRWGGGCVQYIIVTSKWVVDLWLKGVREGGASLQPNIAGDLPYHVILVVPLSINNELVLKRTLQRQFQSWGIVTCSSENGRMGSDWTGIEWGQTHCCFMGTGSQFENVPATATSLSSLHDRQRLRVFRTLL